MPVADLPYRIESLTKDGQYAYLTRPSVRSAKTPAAEDEALLVVEPKKTRTKTIITPTRLRVLRNVNLCDGPGLWDSIKLKGGSDAEPYGFYVNLRLFATRSMVVEYLSGPEVSSYAVASNTPVPTLAEDELVITEENYLSKQSELITSREYAAMLQSRDSHLSLESLEDMVCQIQGLSSIEDLAAPKRGRRKKTAVPTPAVEPERIIAVPRVEVNSSDDEEAAEAAVAATTASDRPSVPEAAVKPKKRKVRASLRDQFVLVQNTPSRVIDVSGFGDTMQHQRGKMLDRVRHGERIAKCTVLSDLFPIVSDNVPAFERAMSALGSRYSHRVAEFRALHKEPTATR